VTIVKVSIDYARCQGHGRCYDLAPQLFGEDAEGYAVAPDGVLASKDQAQAQLAALNCPESAIDLAEEEE
jgi:ferredoxin